jgi:hypothetical protein
MKSIDVFCPFPLHKLVEVGAFDDADLVNGSAQVLKSTV